MENRPEELALQFINGNRVAVINEILLKRNKVKAIALALNTYREMQSRTYEEEAQIFLEFFNKAKR